MNPGKPIYAYFGHHKCGSRWVVSVLEDVCKCAGLRFDRVSWRQQAHVRHPLALQAYIQQRGIDFVAYINANYRFVPYIRNLRGVHVVRDPRDICVSAYYSHLHSHPVRDWVELGQHRAHLQQLGQEDGLLLDMKFSHWVFDDIAAWKYDDPRILEAQLETAAETPIAFFEKTLESMGLLPERITFDQLHEIVARYDFRKLSGGRNPGEEDVRSHYRNGTPGNWREHFKDVHLQYFRAHYDPALVRAGYCW